MCKSCVQAVLRLVTQLKVMLNSTIANFGAVQKSVLIPTFVQVKSPVYYTAKNGYFNLFLTKLCSQYTALITKITKYINILLLINSGDSV
jgi:hypothetical protein